MNMKLAGCFLLFCLSWLPQNSWALCLGCTCSVDYANNIAFGNYNPFSGSNIDITGEIRVRCYSLVTLLASINLKLSKGSSSTYTPRTMTSGSNTLNYNLYTDASRTQIWGDGTNSTYIVRDFQLLGLIAYFTTDTVYARLPAGQTSAAVGSYSDTITLTVEY